jgi:HSP20 family protein
MGLNEYEVGDFYRAFNIHESINSSRISAECKKGVLVVHLPKMEEAKPKQIAVRGQ